MKPKQSKVFQYYDFIMKLADKHRKLGLRTNADTPEQVRQAIAFGAEGIALLERNICSSRATGSTPCVK